MIAPLIEEIEHNQIDTLVFAQDRVIRYIPMGNPVGWQPISDSAIYPLLHSLR